MRSGGDDDTRQRHQTERMTAALCYALSSVLIMYVNKATLTYYSFPSPAILVAAQSLTTLVGLTLIRICGAAVEIPDLTFENLVAIQPFLKTLEYIAGVSGAKHLNMPMFTALRRFSIPLIMFLEFFIIGKRPSRGRAAWVAVMLLGAFVAIANDLNFNEVGYFSIASNNLLTALGAIYTATRAKKMGSVATLYFQSLVSVPLVGLWIGFAAPEQITKTFRCPCWDSMGFLFCFFASCMLGGAVSYTTIWCNRLNGASSTAVVGCLKNTITTYGGMLPFWGDFKFDAYNFLGVNLSLIAGAGYSYLEFKAKRTKEKEEERTSGDSLI